MLYDFSYLIRQLYGSSRGGSSKTVIKWVLQNPSYVPGSYDKFIWVEDFPDSEWDDTKVWMEGQVE